MSNGTKFTESQLKELDFHQGADGVWSKGDLSSQNAGPQTADNQRSECSTALGAQEDEGQGEGGFRYCLVIHSHRTHLIDPNNASYKQIEDCLTEPKGRKKYGIGVIPDDSPEFCDQAIFLQSKAKRGCEATDIYVLKYEI